MTVVNALGRAFRRAAVPLAAYYGVTVAVPLANGAALSPEGAFVPHAVVALVVPPICIVFACLAHLCGCRAISALRPRPQNADSRAGFVSHCDRRL